MAETVLRFGEYRLMPTRRELKWRHESVHLTPTEFELLRIIVEARGMPVSRHELIETIWGSQALASPEGSLYEHLKLLRQKLHRYGNQSWIQNIHGRGYRVAVPVDSLADSGYPAISRQADGLEPVFVGRQSETELLNEHLECASANRGRMVAVLGEVGMGKTSFLEHWIAGLGNVAHPVRIACGRCFQRQTASGAYLPLVEALQPLLGEQENSVGAVGWDLAPTWRDLIGTSGVPHGDIRHARLERELLALLRSLTQDTPLVIWIDDLHWADASTIDLLNYIAHELPRIRVLVVVTYRPSQMEFDRHPFLSVSPDLRTHRLLHDIMLGPLGPADVHLIVNRMFPGNDFLDDLPSLLYRITEGHPLFLSDLVEFLNQQGFVQRQNGNWRQVKDVVNVAHQLPVSTTAAILHKISRLSDEDRTLLSAGAVQGVEFDSVIVADVMEVKLDQAEERLQSIARVHSLIRPLVTAELPDGARTLRFRFAHVLYHNSIFGQLTSARRSLLSFAVAQALTLRYGARWPQLASQLAELFESAGQLTKALDCLLAATRIAARLTAYRQASQLSSHAMRLTERLEDPAERTRLQIEFLNLDLVSNMSQKGFWDLEIERICLRIEDISAAIGPHPSVFRPLFFLWGLLTGTAGYEKALPVAMRLWDSAVSCEDRQLLVHAHIAVGINFLHLGRPPEAAARLEEAVSSAAPPSHSDNDFYAYHINPQVIARCNRARALWLAGFPDQADDCVKRALSIAADTSHDKTLAFAHVIAADIAHFRGEVSQTLELSRRALELAERHELEFERVAASVLCGWALAQRGDLEESVLLFRRHLPVYSGPAVTKFLCHMAQVLAQAGAVAEAEGILQKAASLAVSKGERYYVAEILRVEGELVMLTPDPTHADVSRARDRFQSALDKARQQSSLSLQLRAAISLAEHHKKLGEVQAGNELALALTGFTEGLATDDVRRARRLMEQLGPERRLKSPKSRRT